MKNSIKNSISMPALTILKINKLIRKTLITSAGSSALLIILLFTLSATSSEAGLFNQGSPLVEKQQKGEIDWEMGLIRASGASAGLNDPDNSSDNIAVKRLSVIRAAKIAAMRNILDVIKTVRVDSSTKVETYMIASDFIRNKLHETVRKAKITDKKETYNDGVEVTIELPMLGSFIETMVPDTGGLYKEAIETEQESGIIIDARGIGAKPALSPRILDDSGREFYGASYIKRENFLSKGLVAYRTNLDNARSSARAAGNPIIIKAVRSAGPGNSDLVVASADVKRLKASSSYLNCLEKGNVIIVLDGF